jgi:hypothetical protein
LAIWAASAIGFIIYYITINSNMGQRVNGLLFPLFISALLVGAIISNLASVSISWGWFFIDTFLLSVSLMWFSSNMGKKWNSYIGGVEFELDDEPEDKDDKPDMGNWG